jgi:hypothetical protein
MANYLDSVDWNSLLMKHLTADSLWDSFKSILKTAIDNSVVDKPARVLTVLLATRSVYVPPVLNERWRAKGAYGTRAKIT